MLRGDRVAPGDPRVDHRLLVASERDDDEIGLAREVFGKREHATFKVARREMRESDLGGHVGYRLADRITSFSRPLSHQTSLAAGSMSGASAYSLCSRLHPVAPPSVRSRAEPDAYLWRLHAPPLKGPAAPNLPGHHVEILCPPLELAPCPARTRAQDAGGGDVGPRKVVGGRVAGLQDAQRPPGLGDAGSAEVDGDHFQRRLDPRRPQIRPGRTPATAPPDPAAGVCA